MTALDWDLQAASLEESDPKCSTAALDLKPHQSDQDMPSPTGIAPDAPSSLPEATSIQRPVSADSRAAPISSESLPARPHTADPAAGDSLPPASVRAELDASMHRKAAGPLLPVDVGDGVPARKKLLRKQSEPYIPRRACLKEICQRMHVQQDVADPLCKEDDLICSICLVSLRFTGSLCPTLKSCPYL